MRAKLAHFYGWTHEEIMSLPVDLAEDYWQAITVIEAQNLLELVRVEQSPNLKQNDFKKYADHLERKAYPAGKAKSSGPELSSEDFAKRIGEALGR